MTNDLVKDSEKEQFEEVLGLIETARANVSRRVNEGLMELYWTLGKYISLKLASSEWGEGVVPRLADYIKSKRPDFGGFDLSNLFRMRKFYETYVEDEIVATLWPQLNWSCHKRLFSLENKEERQFYMALAVKEKYTERELRRQIESKLFWRMLESKTEFSPPAKTAHPNIEGAFRDRYSLEFLGLPRIHSEKDLRKGIIANLKDFILEFGRDFTFMGEEYRLPVGNKDYAVDLLFYHRELRCMVAFELKAGEFKPSHLGQMTFYLAALDEQVKKPDENPSVGVLLCQEKDDEVVRLALSKTLAPALVAKYETTINTAAIKHKFHELLEWASPEKED